MDEVGEAISESSDVRPDAQGYAIPVCVCVYLYKPTQFLLQLIEN